MHKCVRCGRAAASLQEINDGCPCGSKVFVFDKEAVGSIAGEEVKATENGDGELQLGKGADAGGPVPQQESGKGEDGKDLTGGGASGTGKADGKAPDSYFARMAFTAEDVENIKVVTQGVFSIDLNALSRDPVVLKDEEGVYYVRIPFEQGEDKPNGKGKKK